MNAFVKAARAKFRFPSIKGPLTFEQLWDLPLQSKSGLSLDAIAQELDKEVQDAGRTSFVDKGGNPTKTSAEERLAMVVFVIESIQEENEKLRQASAKRAERESLLEILHDKKKSEMLGLSKEELEARIKALEG